MLRIPINSQLWAIHTRRTRRQVFEGDIGALESEVSWMLLRTSGSPMDPNEGDEILFVVGFEVGEFDHVGRFVLKESDEQCSVADTMSGQ